MTVFETKLQAAVDDSERFAYCRSSIDDCAKVCDNCTFAHRHYTRVTITEAVENAKRTLERWGFTVMEREI